MHARADLNDETGKRLEQRLSELSERLQSLERRVEGGDSTAVTDQAPADRSAEVEARLGTYWLSRIGIVSLISGVALLIVTYFAQLGPFLRVGVGYSVAAVLAWIGWRLSRHNRLFGQVVFGGGLAIGYFVTYALHFVTAMRVIQSELLGIALVALAIIAIVAIAQRMQSETVAGIALFLGLHTGMITDVSALTLVCTSLLAMGAVFFVAKNRWVIVPITTVVAVYATHATWAYPWPEREEGPALSLAFLCVDFALFCAAALIRPDALRARSLVLLGLSNWVGLTLLGTLELWSGPGEALFWFLVAIAAAEALLALGARLRLAPPEHVQIAVALALVSVALALPVRLTGLALTAGWAVIAVGAAFAARQVRSAAMSILSLVVLAAMLLHTQLEPTTAGAVVLVALSYFAAERLQPAELHRRLRILFVGGAALSLLAVSAEWIPSGLQTLGWVGAASLLFAVGFALKEPLHRWAGFAVLMLSGLRLLILDLRGLSANQRIVTFLAAGVALLLVSFVYTRLKERRASGPNP